MPLPPGGEQLSKVPVNVSVPEERCREDDCPFCAEHLDSSASPFDIVLTRGPAANLVPALGMLVPGYLLLTTQDHLLSMAQLGRPALQSIGEWCHAIQRELTPRFGDYLLFEHGSCAQDLAGACVDHAHVHLVPLARQMGATVADEVRWQEIDDYESLASFAGRSYAYFGWQERHFVLPEPKLGSQWIRRQIGIQLNVQTWDWAIDEGRDALQVTLDRLQDAHWPEEALHPY